MEGLERAGEGFAAGMSVDALGVGGGGSVQFVGEDVAARTAHGVVRRDLHHDLVQVLDDVLELLYGVSALSLPRPSRGHTLETSMVDSVYGRHICVESRVQKAK